MSITHSSERRSLLDLSHRRWATKVSRGGTPTVQGDAVYLGSFDHRVYRFDSRGEQQWAVKAASHLDASPTPGPDGTLYANSRDLHLDILRATAPGFSSCCRCWARSRLGINGRNPQTKKEPIIVAHLWGRHALRHLIRGLVCLGARPRLREKRRSR